MAAAWAYCTFSACFCFLSMAGRTEKPVKLSLGLCGSPLPPDNVLPVQGVTSLANCHMTAPMRGLKGLAQPRQRTGIIRPLVATTALKVPLWAADRYLARASLCPELCSSYRRNGDVVPSAFAWTQNYCGCWERYLDIRQDRPRFVSWRWHRGQYLNCPHSPCMCGHYCKLRLWAVLGCQCLKKNPKTTKKYLHSRAVRMPCSHKEYQSLLCVCLMN